MSPFIPADQLVRKCQTRHEAALFQPEDGGKGSGEEDPLDAGKRHESCPEWLTDSVDRTSDTRKPGSCLPALQ